MVRNVEVFEKQFPSRVFKCILVASLICFIIFTFLKEGFDCSEELLSAKEFEHEKDSLSGTIKTCFLKKYLKRDLQKCFRRKRSQDGPTLKRFTFVGSEEMEEFYSTFKLKFSDENSISVKEDEKYYWRNSDAGIELEYKTYEVPDISFQKLLRTWHKEKLSPDVVIIGFNPFTDNKVTLQNFIANITDLTFELDLIAEDAKVFFSIPYFGLPEPMVPFLLTYKKQIHHLLKGSHVIVWDMTVVRSLPNLQSFANDFDFDSEILLNYFCNPQLETNSSFLCCVNKKDKYFQEYQLAVALIVAAAVIVISVALLYHFWEPLKKASEGICKNHYCTLRKMILPEEVTAMSAKVLPLSTDGSAEGKENIFHKYGVMMIKCFLIFFYFYICDRTNLFEKESKEFRYKSFYLPLIVAFLGAVVWRGASSTTKTLNREITDEWKGWMQIAILIYHITGASSHLGIYMHIRILVSSYLFMTGFGNFSYYWKGGELTFRRYCQVIFRMNLLTIVLCIVMKKHYQFYYFVPLVSFWYTMLFLFLLLPPYLVLKTPEGRAQPSNTDYAIMAAKLIIFFILVTALGMLKKIFDSIFLFPLWRNLFILPGHDDQEWWFRWHLDKYSVIYGAAFGLMYQWLTQSQISEKLKEKSKYFYCLPLLVLLSVACMCAYYVLTSLCFSKQECNLFHPYIVWIPILGYILLRNITESVRGSHSVLMLSAGKVSLELFICQYHIWLAADTRGILVLIPWEFPAFNFMVVTIIFICIAQEVNHITGEFVNLLLPKDNKKICTNLLLVVMVFLLLRFVL